MSVLDSSGIIRRQPSASALRVAKARAVHQLLDDPIVFPDTWALPILGQVDSDILQRDPFALNDPVARGMRAGVVARSRFAEDALHSAVKKGVTQYVILGAGLDTYLLRNPHGDALQLYEVDHPCTQRFKRERLAELGAIPANTRFVPMDFQCEDVIDRLTEAGLDTTRPTVFSWLGVSVYLPRETVLAVLGSIANLAPGSGIVFDYRVETRLLDPVEQMMESFSAKAFAAMGEPWLSSFDPPALHATLMESGYAIVEDVGPAELNKRYFPRRRDGLQTSGGGFRFLCIERA